MCASWPHACMRRRSSLANSRPVSSGIGSASMSARSRTVGPGATPCRSATTDVTVVAGAHVEAEAVERVEHRGLRPRQLEPELGRAVDRAGAARPRRAARGRASASSSSATTTVTSARLRHAPGTTLAARSENAASYVAVRGAQRVAGRGARHRARRAAADRRARARARPRPTTNASASVRVVAPRRAPLSPRSRRVVHASRARRPRPRRRTARPRARPRRRRAGRPPLALRVGDRPRVVGRRRARQVVGPGPHALAQLGHRSRRIASRSAAAFGCASARRPPTTADAPRRRPTRAAAGARLQSCAALPRAAPGPASSYVPSPARELAPVDHAAQRDPGGALGDAEQPAPLHEPGARHPRRVASASSRLAISDRAPSGRSSSSPVLRSCRHLFGECNIGGVTATMLPEPDAARRVPPHRPPHRNGPARARVPRGAAPHPERAQRVRGRVCVYVQTIGIIVARGVARQLVRVDRRVPAHGPRPRAVRGADARGRAPPAVPQPQRQRLGRPLAARLPVVHADRPLPPRPHGAPPRRVRPRRARHPALPRLPDLEGLAPPQARARRDRPDRLEAVQGPARAASLPTDAAVRFQARRDRRRCSSCSSRSASRSGTRGCTSSSGSRRTSPCGASSTGCARSPSTAACSGRRTGARPRTPCASTALARFVLVPYHIGWHLAHHVDSGVPMANLPKLHAELRRVRLRHRRARVPAATPRSGASSRRAGSRAIAPR